MSHLAAGKERNLESMRITTMRIRHRIILKTKPQDDIGEESIGWLIEYLTIHKTLS